MAILLLLGAAPTWQESDVMIQALESTRVDDRPKYLPVSWRLVIASAGVRNIYNLHGLAAIR